MAIMDDIIASVEPQQTVISRSGSTVHALRACEFLGDGVAQRLRAPGDGVLIDRRRQWLRCAARLYFDGSGKVRKALRQIDGLVLKGQARHFADYGFSELRGLQRKFRADACGSRRV